MNTREGHGTEAVRELLPDWVAGRLDEPTAERVETAVKDAPELAEEARVLRTLLGSRVDPPAWLEARIVEAVQADRAHRVAPPADESGRRADRGQKVSGRFALPRWGLAAAAVAVLAVGLTEMLERRVAPPEPTLEQVALEDAPNPWLGGDDGAVFVAGAPVFDELSDEALLTLLEELGG